VTARTRNFVLFVLALFVCAPSLATLVDVGPMGYHAGGALLVRLVATFLATTSLAAAVGIGMYLYWLHVISPAQHVHLHRHGRTHRA